MSGQAYGDSRDIVTIKDDLPGFHFSPQGYLIPEADISHLLFVIPLPDHITQLQHLENTIVPTYYNALRRNITDEFNSTKPYDALTTSLARNILRNAKHALWNDEIAIKLDLRKQRESLIQLWDLIKQKDDRPKRSLLGAVIATAKLANGIVHAFTLGKIQKRLQALETETDFLANATSQLGHDVTNLMSVQQLLVRYASRPTSTARSIRFRQEVLRNTSFVTTSLTSGLVSLLNQRLSPLIVPRSILEPTFDRLVTLVRKHGYEPLWSHYAQAFQSSCTYYVTDTKIVIEVPIWVRLQIHKEFRILKLANTPMLQENQPFILDTKDEYLAADNSLSHFIPSPRLDTCTRVGRTWLCSNPDAIRNDFSSHCLANALKGQLGQRCLVVEPRAHTIVKRLNSTRFSIFQPEPTQFTVSCKGETTSSRILTRGRFLVDIRPGCEGAIGPVRFQALHTFDDTKTINIPMDPRWTQQLAHTTLHDPQPSAVRHNTWGLIVIAIVIVAIGIGIAAYAGVLRKDWLSFQEKVGNLRAQVGELFARNDTDKIRVLVG